MKGCAFFVLGSCLCWWPGLLPAAAADGEILTAVYSTAYNGYARATGSDGSFRPETYTLGEGGHASGSMRDASNEDVTFIKLARLLAPYLARQNYVPSPSSAGTDLLIVVHWGATTPYDGGSYGETLASLQTALQPLQKFGGPPAPGTTTRGSLPSIGSSNAYRQQLTSQVDGALAVLNLQNQLRDRANVHNAALLGYLPELNRDDDIRQLTGLRTYYRDLESDLEEGRYYVILAAFDFQRAWKQKQLKLLWVTRVSIRAHGHRFDEHLEAMVQNAGRYFGQDSHGLMRWRVPAGQVEVGEPTVIEVVPDAGK
jgi:hypothetical protein